MPNTRLPHSFSSPPEFIPCNSILLATAIALEMNCDREIFPYALKLSTH